MKVTKNVLILQQFWRVTNRQILDENRLNISVLEDTFQLFLRKLVHQLKFAEGIDETLI